REPVHGVSPEGDFDFAPREQEIGVVPLLLSQRTHAIHEGQGRCEVRKLVGPHQMMLVNHTPLGALGKLTQNFRELSTLERRNAAATGNTRFVGKGSHCSTSGRRAPKCQASLRSTIKYCL